MRSALFVVLLFSVSLDAPFLSAEATALRVEGDMMLIEVSVETERSAAVVLVRAIGPDDQPLDPVAMEATGSAWSTRLSLPRRSDIRLSFEHLDSEGFSFISRPALLIELGIDAAVFSLDEPPPDGGVDQEEAASRDTRWLWLALGLGAAALAVVLVAVGWRRTDDDSDA